ncbi:DUF6234 family protein [Streptomyces sp. NPDC005151]
MPEVTPLRQRPVGGAGLDIALGLLLVALEVVVCAIATFRIGMAGWADSYDGTPEAAEPPPMDWGPVITFGVITLVVVAITVALLRTNRPWAGSIQVCVALVLCIVTVQIGQSDYRRSHPAPASTPSDGPGRSGHQCLSGGDNHECRDSGS